MQTQFWAGLVVVGIYTGSTLFAFDNVGIAKQTESVESIRLAPGDDKSGYENKSYTTNSLSLERRQGQRTNLLKLASEAQLGLPDPSAFAELAPHARQIELGRQLFFDRRLSRNKTMSCAMCHIPEQGFTSNELKRPIGFEGRAVKRNAPSLLNVRFYQRLFVDARESSLVQQVWSPLLAANEMNNPSVGYVVEQIQADESYLELFEQAFASEPNMLNIGIALAQYQQSLIAGDSPFDRWHFGGDEHAINEQAQQGFELFIGKAGCAGCHRINNDYALFTDQQLHNTGAGYRESMKPTNEDVKVLIAPGVEAQVSAEFIQQLGESKPNDLGRYEVTLEPEDRWKFRTPSLRNVDLTAPYMHNGEFLSLADVVDFYDQGGEPHSAQSPLIKPLTLNKAEKQALVAFMKSLTSQTTAELVADAFAVKVQDPE